MLISLDPTQMIAAAEALRNCAIEAADIGSQLSSCACCAMPADVQPIVDELATTVDRALDSVAAGLSVQAADLTNRAQIAAGDSLSAAASSVDTGTAISAASGSGSAMFTTSIIGGQPLTEPIILGTAPAAASPGLTVSIIGGGAQGDLGFGNPVVNGTGLGVSVIGGQQGSVVGDSLGGSGLGVSVIGGQGQSIFNTGMYDYPGGRFQTIGTALPPGAFAGGLASNPDPMRGVMAVFGGPAFGQITVQV